MVKVMWLVLTNQSATFLVIYYGHTVINLLCLNKTYVAAGQ